MIEIINLTKELDGELILKSVNLKLESGKIYGFIGKNGSGKSVLFKIISGIYYPTSGSVVINGIDIHAKKLFYSNMRALIEKPTFISYLTGYENLKVLANVQNLITDEEIYEALKLVNLYEEKDKKYSKYSLGMKQKLGLAQVFMENPEVMLLDEPFNGIEDNTVSKIKDFLLKEKAKGKIILLASHIKDDILDLADIVYKIENKEIKNK